jgi:hypothetical protein
MYSPGPNIATSSNVDIDFDFYVENVGRMGQNYLKKLCFVATVSFFIQKLLVSVNTDCE